MNPAYLHLLTNHIPILGTVFVAIVLAWALVFGSRDIARFGLIGTVALALITIPIFRTGEPAEEFLEDQAWFDEDTAHEHEERAEVGLILVLITGAGAGVGLWLSRKGRAVPKGMTGAVLAGLVASAAAFGWSALEGGKIRHAEAHDGGATQSPLPVPESAEDD